MHTANTTNIAPAFDAGIELAALRARTRLCRKARYRKSQLDRHAGALLALRRHGASAVELHRWLKTQRIDVAHSTVTRWLARHE
jgi:hypothetical protein